VPEPVRDLVMLLARERLSPEAVPPRESMGLPAYIYDLVSLDAHAARIRAALPDEVEFYYAVKANPDPAVLRTVAGHADGLEVSSSGELGHVAREAGGQRRAFGGPGKSVTELAAAVRARATLHVESPHELRLLASVLRDQGSAATADVLLRVNLDVPVPESAGLVMGGAGPFGMDCAGLAECAEILARAGGGPRGLRLRGLHAHLASGLDVDDALRAAAGVLRFAREWCARQEVRDPVITLGGGMTVDYRRPEETFDWERYGRGLAQLAGAGPPGETLRVEPGRAVTAYCGWYATRVLDVKRNGGAAFAVVAGGTHHLRTPAAKGHSQPFAVFGVSGDEGWPHPWARPGVTDTPVTVTGQLCTPKDVLAREVRVGRVRAGDVIVFGLAGAYAWNISHTRFLMHPEPGFHYLGRD
jgi:diaminopimelate decarboxylase